jgi:sporadic carbohydrate cluster 2OG-Fe(II) oxygenase
MSDLEFQTGNFLSTEERELSERFAAQGYLIAPVENHVALDRIRAHVAAAVCEALGIASLKEDGDDALLDHIHGHVAPDQLNALRLSVIGAMAAAPWFRPAYFSLARQALSMVVGNELAMQRRVNLSIQLPGDAESLLPVHADVWSGDSPFEAVLWVPLVDCYGTKAMYLLPPSSNAVLSDRLHQFAEHSAEDIYRSIEPEVEWMAIPYGHYLLFNQNLAHGNRVNREPETRWSMNCRFKGVFTPYADKKLGEFFEPITLRAMSRIGMDYRLPGGFDE